MLNKIFALFLSPAIVFVFIRYISYFLSLINTILLISVLGTYSYGIYSFLILLLTYMSYANIGIDHSLNAELSVKKNNKIQVDNIWGTTCSLNILLSMILILLNFILVIFMPDLFCKYDYNNYYLIILIIGVLSNTNRLYVAIYRIYGRLFKININQILPQLFIFIFILFFRSYLTVRGILLILCFSNVLSLLLFWWDSPLKISFIFLRGEMSYLLKRGLHLLLQTLSFTFITMSATTVVSVFYSADELGYYSLSNTIAISVIMVIDSFMFILYPKMLNRFSFLQNKDAGILLIKINTFFSLGGDSISLLSLLCVPFIAFFFPEYRVYVDCFKILTLAQIVHNIAKGSSAVLIAKKQEVALTKYGVMSVVLVITLSFILSYGFGVEFYYISFAVFIGLSLYAFLILKKSYDVLNIRGLKSYIISKIGLSKMISIIIITISFLLKDDYILPIVTVLLFVMLNFKKLINLLHLLSKSFVDKKLLDF